MTFQEKLEISLIKEEDASAFWAMIERNRERLKKDFSKTISPLTNLSATQDFINHKIEEFKNKSIAYFTIKVEGIIAGTMSAKNIDWTVPKCEIGYFLDNNYEGMGITTQAVEWLVNYCFNEMNMVKVYARINPENIGSRKVLMKNGFNLEGLLIKDYRDGNNDLIDVEYYGRIKA